MAFWKEGFWKEGFWQTDFWEGFGGAGGGTDITNANATIDVQNNYVICSRTGFRQFADVGLERDGYGELIRKDSIDQFHPQDNVRSRGGDRQYGPESPELNDVFVSTSTAPGDL